MSAYDEYNEDDILEREAYLEDQRYEEWLDEKLMNEDEDDEDE